MKKAKRRRWPTAAATIVAADAAKDRREEHEADFLRIARDVMKKHERVLRALANELDELPPDDADANSR